MPSLGLDIVEVQRIERLSRKNARFLPRIFTPEEIRYCESRRKKWQHYAVRFAAKEAVWKVLGRLGLPLRSISIQRSPQGRPSVSLRGRRIPYIQVSLSHCKKYAAAVALAAEPGQK